MNQVDRDRSSIGVILGGRQLDLPITQHEIRQAFGPCCTGFLLTLLCSSTLFREGHPDVTFYGGLTNSSKQFEGGFFEVAIMLGADQDIHSGVITLLVKELEKIRFSITYVNEPCLRHRTGQCHQVTMMFDPDKGLFFLNRDL